MALVVTTDLALVCDGTTAQAANWTGTDGVSTEVFQQGVSSEGWVVGKNSNETAVFDYYTQAGNTAANLSTTDCHVYWHMRCDIAPFIDYMKIRFTDGSGNWSEWTVVDNTTTIEWYGEWKTFIVDVNSTPTATSGTLVLSDVRTFSWNVDNSNSGNIRSIENTYIDVCRFGTGIGAYDDVGTAFNFADIEAIANNVANKYGIIENIGGVLFIRGRVKIGYAVTALDANCVSEDELLVFLAPSVSGETIGDGLLGVSVQGHKDGTTTFTMGNKLGTGDTLTGSNGTLMLGEDTNVVVSFDFPNTTVINDMSFYGSTFRRIGGPIELDGATEIGGCTFDGCDIIHTGGALTRNCTFLNTVAPITSAAMLIESGFDVKYCFFSNNLRALAVGSSNPVGDYTAVGLEFIGNTFDIRYDSTVDKNWNWSEADAAPTITNITTGTLTAVNTVDLSIASVLNGARIYIETESGGPLGTGIELVNELATGTTWTDTYAYTSAQPVLVRVRYSSVPGSEKKPWALSTSITSAGLDLIAQLIDDD